MHSPRSCIPSDGWEMADFQQRDIRGVRIKDQPLRVNRAVIKKGDAVQLVYYWFQQRGRLMTNEYLVKWYLFQDSLTRGRTDGALVRLTTSIASDEEIRIADERLSDLIRLVAIELEPYVPN